MRCDFCGHHEAVIVVYLAQVEESTPDKLFLCRRCAKHVSVAYLVEKGIGGERIRREKALSRKKKSCPFCLLPLHVFLESGILGCPYCYSAFSREIAKRARREQAGDHHRGTIPWRYLQRKKIQQSLSQALRDLERCVAEERYEQAERLKKLIERLRSLL